MDSPLSVPVGQTPFGIEGSVPSASVARTQTPRWKTSGILAGSVDDFRRRHPSSYPEVAATRDLVVWHNASGRRGHVISVSSSAVKLRLADGRISTHRRLPGAFRIDGRNVSLVQPKIAPVAPATTRSGSVSAPTVKAKVARAARIWVEGVHDAELIEKIWGDDLRHVGVVVEPMHGADDLAAMIAEFQPGHTRRLGVLLDHMIEGTKEARIAAAVDQSHVLVLGHPFVDVWEAVKPQVVGIEAWPRVPMGTDWKTGICDALGVGEPPAFWRRVVGQVESFTDLDVSLINSVERLIDFVTE
ncbi:MAG: DUF3097 family protein [Actinomycetia bacterium]|nr:DUF3097 family protein [Actinomycetes bacterium]MCP4961067.1 DUF3097 family protein [Actinomycetes bacterium]